MPTAGAGTTTCPTGGVSAAGCRGDCSEGEGRGVGVSDGKATGRATAIDSGRLDKATGRFMIAVATPFSVSLASCVRIWNVGPDGPSCNMSPACSSPAETLEPFLKVPYVLF